MAVNRIDQLNINSRPLFIGIFGSSGTSEYFIERDLRKYTLQQELYLYLRSQRYITIFYNNHTNFFSFEEEQLAIFWRLKEEETNDQQNATASAPTSEVDRIFNSIRSPFQRSRVRNHRLGSNAREETHFSQITISHSAAEDKIYRIANDENIFDRIFKFTDDYPHRKLAVIITNPNTLSFNKDLTDLYISRLQDYIRSYKAKDLQLKIIALYTEQKVEAFVEDMKSFSSEFFYHQIFKNLLFPDLGSETSSGASSSSLFYLPFPDKDEIENWLNRRRLLEGLEGLFSPKRFKNICHLLWQDMTTVSEGLEKKKIRHDYISERDSLSTKQISDYIRGLSTETAWDRLDSMAGIDSVRSQFRNYVEDLRRSREQGIDFMPHMVLEGNPGTGKTTLAHLFAEILHEEGVLPKGHVVEATVADMEGEYVGSTRIKTQALCQRAKGGVLFIDEAYGLYDGSGNGEHVGYGKEAVEVLIQHMSNNSDSVVILAGYQEQTEDMLNKVNPGFKRRFNKMYGKFLIEDYAPEVLLSMCLNYLQKKHLSISSNSQKLLLQVLSRMYQMRDQNWGNASEAVQCATILYNNHCRLHPINPANTAIESESFPEEWLQMISNEMHDDEEVLKELDQLIGMNDVKEEIKDFLLSVRSQRDEMRLSERNIKLDIPMNFILMGNPGTGKTTLAGILARVLKNYGVLSSSVVKPVGKDQLVSPLAGQGGKNVDKIMSDSINGVFFIDEAYQLASPDASDAVTALVNNLTNPKFEGKLLVVLAGYYDEMQRFLDSNSGLSRRFDKQIIIGDYTNDDLWQILLKKASKLQWQIPDYCKIYADAWFQKKRQEGKRFGNAGECDILIKQIERGRNRRLYKLPKEERENLSIRFKILAEDFPNFKEISEIIHNVQKDSSPNANGNPVQGSYSQQIQINLREEDPSRRVAQDADYDWATCMVEVKNGTGTGFLFSIKQRLMMTCSHVIENGEKGDVVSTANISFMAGSFRTIGHVIWNDISHDMAILQLDSLPKQARYFALDTQTNIGIRRGEKIVHCGYPHGSTLTCNLSAMSGEITSIEKDKLVGVRRFDTLFSNVNAINGCSGGPVFRQSDHLIVGVLQGGFASDTRIIIDIHQLFGLIPIFH